MFPARDNILFGLEQVVATPHLGASTTEAQENVAIQVAELLQRHDPWPWKPHKRSTVEQVITDHPGSVRWACGMLDYGNSPTKPLHLCKDAEALLQRQPRTAKQYV